MDLLSWSSHLCLDIDMPDFDFLEELNNHISVLLGFSERGGGLVYIYMDTHIDVFFSIIA